MIKIYNNIKNENIFVMVIREEICGTSYEKNWWSE